MSITKPWAPALAVLGVLALAGCERKASEPPPAPASTPPSSPAPTPAPRVSDFSQPMTARGTEPFWALTMNGTRFTLQRPDQPEMTFEAPGATIQSGQATWVARSADGQQLTVTLYISDCSDGMSDLKYPMAAELVLLNERLSGCAAKTAELPKGGG